jgi:hypothetical protein
LFSLIVFCQLLLLAEKAGRAQNAPWSLPSDPVNSGGWSFGVAWICGCLRRKCSNGTIRAKAAAVSALRCFRFMTAVSLIITELIWLKRQRIRFPFIGKIALVFVLVQEWTPAGAGIFAHQDHDLARTPAGEAIIAKYVARTGERAGGFSVTVV